MKTYTTVEHRCPSCKTLLDQASGVNGTAAPKPEDISICLYCQAWLIFNTDMSVRLASQEDIEEMSPDILNVMQTVTVAMQEIKKSRSSVV